MFTLVPAVGWALRTPGSDYAQIPVRS